MLLPQIESGSDENEKEEKEESELFLTLFLESRIWRLPEWKNCLEAKLRAPLREGSYDNDSTYMLVCDFSY